MRKLIIAFAVTTAVGVFATAALGVPRVGQRFTGITSAKPVAGFSDTVTFVTGSRSLKGFSFGTLGCFGYGQFPDGVDPFGISIAQVATTIPMTATGTFSLPTTVATWAGGDATTKLLVSISGKFTGDALASGTITVSEKLTNGGTCGPVKMTFTAKPGSRVSS